MGHQFSQLLDHILGVGYCVAGVVAIVSLASVWIFPGGPNLDKIPTVGANTWLGSWWAGIKFVVNAADVIQEGYDRYKGTPFKVSTFYRWTVILSGRQHVEELRRSRDDELSFLEAVADTLKADYTFGHDAHYNRYHFAILSSKFNRNLGILYADVRDEIATAFDDILRLEDHEWKTVPVLDTIQQIVARSSNRAFVGLPLCRDPDWLDLNIGFTWDVIKGATVISLFPNFMAPFVARFMTNLPGRTRRGVKHLAPLIEARQRYLEKHSTSWDDEPKDLLYWFVEGSEGSQRNASNITSRILAINFASIHSSSHTLTQALCYLAANPQYIQPLREEVESIIQEEGWSKAAVEKMHKVDSFMKESQRIDGLGVVNMMRKAMKDVTLSDGTVIPKGTFVAMATQAVHHDNEFYENPEVFDPFRFSRMRKEDTTGVEHQFSTTSPEYLVFGHGRHACPGRFFAASVLNTMLAHLVVSYDLKLEDGASRPRNVPLGIAITANPTARIMIKRRAT